MGPLLRGRSTSLDLLRQLPASTMRGRRQDPASGNHLDWSEIEVMENGASLVLHERAPILVHDDAPVSKHTISNRWGRFIDDHDIDITSARPFEAHDQIAELERAQARTRLETHGDVEIAAFVRGFPCSRPEHKGITDARIVG
jgi:hypothetical protein